MAFYKEDIVSIELQNGTIFRSFMNHAIGSGDALENRFGVRVFRNGEPEDIGGTVMGLFVRADGGTVTIASGTVSGNEAYITLPEACYAVEGNFSLAIKCTGSGVTGTLRIVDGVVSKTSTDAVVDPGTIIPSVEALIDAIDDAVASIPADYSSLWTSLAPAFSTSNAYSIGQYVTYDGKLWRFTTAHAAGSWNSAHVTQVALGPDVSDLKSAFNSTPTVINNAMMSAVGMNALNIINLTSDNVTILVRNSPTVVHDSYSVLVKAFTLANIVNIIIPCEQNTWYQLQCDIERVSGTGNYSSWIGFFDSIPAQYYSPTDMTPQRLFSGNKSYVYVGFYVQANTQIEVTGLNIIKVSSHETVSDEIEAITKKQCQSDYNYDAFLLHSDGVESQDDLTITKKQCDYIFNGDAGANGTYHIITSAVCFNGGDVFYINFNNSTNLLYLQVDIYSTSLSAKENILTENASGCYRIELPATLYKVDIYITYLSGRTYNNACNVMVSRFTSETGKIFRTSEYDDSIIKTVKAAQNYYGSIVLLDNLSYDIVDEFVDYYGETFFTEYSPAVPDGYGIVITNGMTIRGNADAVITCNPADYITETNKIYLNFSPFMLGGRDCTLESLNIECANTKYCIHDDWGFKAEKYRHIIRNCKLKHIGSGLRSIGGGFTTASETIIEGCYFDDYYTQQYPVHFHNNGSNASLCKLFIMNNYFVHGGVGLANYGPSTEKSTAYICGNSYLAEPVIEFIDEQTYPNVNMEYVAWCNELRQS